jgi:hypothetical protein
MVKFIEDLLAPAKPVSKMPVRLEKSGGVSVDVQAYLATENGKEELARLGRDQAEWDVKEAKSA